jgi:hypothetical protein
MLIKTKNINRRNVLQGMLNGAAVTVSLPLLEVFLNDSGTALAATGEVLPVRFGTWFWGLGINQNIFTPKIVGPDYDLPLQLQPLAKVKQHVNVFTNYNVLTDGRPNLCHYTGWVALRCGAAPGGRGQLPGQSLDVAIADAVGGGTRFRSICLTATGAPRDSYSFLSADAINPPDISPAEFYQKIFGPEFQDPNSPNFKPDPQIMMRRSVLSAVSEQRKTMERELGAADKARLDEYYTSIRELETRLDLQMQKPPPAPSCKAPPRPPAELPIGVDVELVSARHRAMADLLVMALACNQTKIFNMVYSDSASSLTRKGLDKTHHIVTHEEVIDSEKGYQIEACRFVGDAFKELAYFLEKLASVSEGDGTLLDHCLVYAHSDCQLAKTHSIDGIPMLTAGRLNGAVRTGLHVDGKGEPGTRLGYTLQRLMGLPVTSWGQGSMQTSREITDIVA